MSTLHARTAAFALVVAVALQAYGCGSSTTSSQRTAQAIESSAQTASTTASQSPTPSGPLTKAALIVKADEICHRMNVKRGAIKITTMEDYARYLPTLAAEELAEISELRKLTPPKSLAGDWQAILAANQTIANSSAKVAEYEKAHNEVGGARKLLVASVKAQALIAATAQRNGFDDCSRFS